MKKCFLFIALTLFFSNSSWGFNRGATYVGLGVYSQNIMGRVASKDTGAGSFLGTSSYHLLVKHDFSVFGDWYFSPHLGYSIMARSSAADSAKTTMMQLVLPFGKNFGSGEGKGFDWFLGPGIIRYDLAGPGGTTTMNNGTGNATFALPARTSVIQNVTFNVGLGYGLASSRCGADLVIENLGSSGKRAMSLMLSQSFFFR